MAAKIGILGESTVVDNTVTTVYTVPADKAARIRILFCAEKPSSSDRNKVIIEIGMPGGENNIVLDSVTTGQSVWTGAQYDTTNDDLRANTVTLRHGTNINFSGAADGAAWVIAPMPIDYYLSTGDTVIFQYEGTTRDDAIFQVVGVEDDA